MLAAALTGYATAFSLILAIGAQNAFVLRQGLTGQHVLALVLLCSISDAVLIVAGVAGFGALVTLAPALPAIMALGGAAFLLVYGALRLHAAWCGESATATAQASGTRRAVLLTGAALTWLNPHVYLDTLALIGAVSTRFEGIDKLAFGLGAVTSSFSFFLGLGFGARALSPYMTNRRVWRGLDLGIGITMWLIAGGLVLSVLP